MAGKKGFLTAEFVLVVLTFTVMLFAFSSAVNTFVPSELGKIHSSTACLRAELLADALLNSPGKPVNWHKSGSLTRLGFSSGSFGELNYSKWVRAQNVTYLTITNQTGLNESFLIRYSAYAIKPVNSSHLFIEGNPNPNESIIIYTPNASLVGIYARNSPKRRHLVVNVELFFPFANVTENLTTFIGSPLEPSDSSRIYNSTEGATVKVHFNLQNDSDQVRFNLTHPIDILFIRDLSFYSYNESLYRLYPVFYNNISAGVPNGPCLRTNCSAMGTLLRDNFGSTGFLDASKNYCEVKRKMTLVNGTHKIGVDISVLAEG